MGILRDWIFGVPAGALSPLHGAPAFAVTPDDIPPSVLGIAAYDLTSAGPAAKMDRKRAMQTPAFKRVRDLICGPLGTMPLLYVAPDGAREANQLFRQPEKDVPRSVTMTRTAEDMLLDGVAWWEVTDFDGVWPSRIKRLKKADVTVDDANSRVYHKGRHIPNDRLIKFESPTAALLESAARAGRASYDLEHAASVAADGTPPMEYFTPKDPQDQLDDDEVVQFLDDWLTARRKRTAGFVPGHMEHHIVGWSPEQLQLVAARAEARLGIALEAGVDPEEVGVSTTSRTYANMFERRKAFLDFTLGPYRQAVEDRLSMNDVTPDGYTAAYDIDAFLRTDPLTRMQTYQVGRAVGAYTEAEVREAEGRAPLTDQQKKDVASSDLP